MLIIMRYRKYRPARIVQIASSSSSCQIMVSRKSVLFTMIFTFCFATCFTVNTLSRQPVYSSRYTRRQTADYNEGGLPSAMPSPPEHDKQPRSTSISPVQDTTNMPHVIHTGPFGPNEVYYDHTVEYYYAMGHEPHLTTVAPEEDSEEDKPEEESEEEDEDEEDEEPAPFGLEETILILVPQVKYKIHNLPKWCGASFKLSYPITIFFDELDWPKGFNILGSLFNKKRPQAPAKERRGRSIMSLPPATSFPGMDRATLIPKLESTLKSSGLGGRACLLRSVCEVHEAELFVERYGFLGEMLTRIFTISNSAYAESHLPGYLEAERRGKAGNCSAYLRRCSYSLFETNSEHCEKGVKNC